MRIRVGFLALLFTASCTRTTPPPADVGASSGAPTTSPVVSIIDTFGLRRVTAQAVRAALRVTEGQPPPDDAGRKEAERRVAALPGVRAASVYLVCCDNGGTILYLGVEENDSPAWHFRPAPTGEVRLPPEIVKAGEDYDAAIERAVRNGDNTEDDSQGHMLSHNPAARTFEDEFIRYAAKNVPLLREVLHNSADDKHRALAAQILAYAADKRSVSSDLIAAIDDPSDDVRNNSIRGLWVMAMAKAPPEGRLSRGTAVVPLVRLLSSPVWTDRNKSSMALFALSNGGDREIVRAIRGEALRALADMARWKSQGHAMAAFWLLGRVAGQSDDAIADAWEKGDRESVFREALKQL
jgi:hypothetical protein